MLLYAYPPSSDHAFIYLVARMWLLAWCRRIHRIVPLLDVIHII